MVKSSVLKLKKFKPAAKYSLKQVILVAGAFAAVGGIAIILTHAATLSNTFEPEDGAITGNASVGTNDANVSGRGFIKFGGSTGGTGSAGCGFSAAAFCEDFTGGAKSGGRAGQLDPTKWSVTRYVGDDQGVSGQMLFPDTPVSACKAGVGTFSPSNDIMVCDSASGHANQALVALSAQNYAAISMRPRQPFDFAGRTGTITFDADATTEGGLSWWPGVFISDQPDALVTNSSQVMGLLPKNGIGINFDACAQSAGTAILNSVNSVFTYANYVETSLAGSNADCFTTQRGVLNHIQIKLSQTTLEVWASNKSTDGGQTFPNFRKIYSTAINLNFSRGYVHFMTNERAPMKYNHLGGFGLDQDYTNMYWTKLGFDGPVINTGEVGYMLPDSLRGGSGGKNVNHLLPNDATPNTFTLSGVNLTGVTGAKVTFALKNIFFNNLTTSNVGVHYSINGGSSHVPNPSPNYAAEILCPGCPGAPTGGGGSTFSFPVSLSELHEGSNTFTLSVDNAPGTGGWVSSMSGFELLTFTANAPL